MFVRELGHDRYYSDSAISCYRNFSLFFVLFHNKIFQISQTREKVKNFSLYDTINYSIIHHSEYLRK